MVNKPCANRYIFPGLLVVPTSDPAVMSFPVAGQHQSHRARRIGLWEHVQDTNECRIEEKLTHCKQVMWDSRLTGVRGNQATRERLLDLGGGVVNLENAPRLDQLLHAARVGKRE